MNQFQANENKLSTRTLPPDAEGKNVFLLTDVKKKKKSLADKATLGGSKQFSYLQKAFTQHQSPC